MPYTPSGGYYEAKASKTRKSILRKTYTSLSHFPDSHPTVRQHLRSKGFTPRSASLLAGRLGPQPKIGKYAVMICFDGPQAKLLAEQVHKHLTGKVTMINQKITDNPKFLAPQVKGALLGWNGENIKAWPCSVALHDCQKHPLNVKY